MTRGIRMAMLKVAMQDPRQWGFDEAFSLTRFDSCEVPYQQVQVQSGARWTHSSHDPTRLSIPSNSMQHQTMLLHRFKQSRLWSNSTYKFFLRNQRLLFSIRRRQFDLRSSYGSRQLTRRRLTQIFASFQNAGIRPLQLRNWMWSLRISSAWVTIRLSPSDW